MNSRVMQTSAILTAAVAVLVGCRSPGSGVSGTHSTMEALHDSTVWQVQPSFKYDVLSLLNTLTGDPYYLQYYHDEYAHFEGLLTRAAREALADLQRKIKDEGGSIISAFLTLYFSATEDETLDEMLATLENSRTMRDNLQATPYYNDSGWELYLSVRPELKTIFEFLKAIDLPEYWRERVHPRVTERIREIEPQLPKYDVVREVERLLGRRLPSDTITVYMLSYSQPHGIRITGTRFLTDLAWPFSIVLRNAVHEMMHPPYDYREDPQLRTALTQLRADEFLMDKVEHHNPAYGYNSFEGFVEEDVVQALDQIIGERLGIARDAQQRWRESDDGMHVLAVALYSLMKEERFAETDERLRDFLIRIIETGKLAPGRIELIYDDFYVGVQGAHWSRPRTRLCSSNLRVP